MTVEKRSPWVVLGIPFPATKAEANRAFARRSRALKREGSLPWTQEDLSWALAAITLIEESPEVSVEHYRLPADPGVFDRPAPGDLFVPEERPIARRTEPGSPSALDELVAQAAIAELRAVLDSAKPMPDHDPYQQAAGATD